MLVLVRSEVVLTQKDSREVSIFLLWAVCIHRPCQLLGSDHLT